MKINLVCNTKLELPSKLSFNKRVKYINKNIFNNKMIINNDNTKKKKQITYENYYNLNSLSKFPKYINKNIKKRWIGIKRPNMPYPDDTFKNTFDHLANYLLSSKDYSAKKYIHSFAKLKRKKFKNKKLNEDEQNEFQKIRKRILFYKILPRTKMNDDIIFYKNIKYENFIKNKLKKIEIELLKNKNPHKIQDLHRMKIRLTKDLNDIKDIKSKVEKYKNEIDKHRNNISSYKSEINKLYGDLKIDKNNEILFNEIVSIMDQIRKLKNNIKFLEEQIRYLTDDYLIITELQVKYS